jgi:hypothetical protein
MPPNIKSAVIVAVVLAGVVVIFPPRRYQVESISLDTRNPITGTAATPVGHIVVLNPVWVTPTASAPGLRITPMPSTAAFDPRTVVGISDNPHNVAVSVLSLELLCVAVVAWLVGRRKTRSLTL